MAEIERRKEPEEKRGVVRLWEIGADFAGGLAGGFAGTLGGPPGIVLGAASGVAVARSLRAVAEEVEEHVLAPRQHARIGGVWAMAVAEIEQRRATGEKPRTDGFFETQSGRRPDAHELLEGVLLRARDEYEERKLSYIAHLYAEVCFREEIGIGYAHHLLRVGERLSYRQFCLLALFGVDRDIRMGKEVAAIARGDLPQKPTPGVIAELDQLGTESLLGIQQKDGSVSHFATTYGGGSFGGVEDDSRITLTEVGRDLHDLLGLAEMPERDIEILSKDLHAGRDRTR
jgi:hypothetical protein